jgi:hypothetical protein
VIPSVEPLSFDIKRLFAVLYIWLVLNQKYWWPFASFQIWTKRKRRSFFVTITLQFSSLCKYRISLFFSSLINVPNKTGILGFRFVQQKYFFSYCVLTISRISSVVALKVLTFKFGHDSERDQIAATLVKEFKIPS